MTSAAVRLVVVEGATGDGATIGHATSDVPTVRAVAAASAEEVVNAVLGRDAISPLTDNRLLSVGITWSDDAADDALTVLEALAESGFDNVVSVCQSEAADALATGIHGLGAYDDVAVCIVEPDEAYVAIANRRGVHVEDIDRDLEGRNADELAHSIGRRLHVGAWAPEAILVLGSAGDLEWVVASLGYGTPAPVVSAAEAGLALARGAALASARAMSAMESSLVPEAPITGLIPSPDEFLLTSTRRPWSKKKVGTLTGVLVAAGLTFVVSLSMALGVDLTPESETAVAEQKPIANKSAKIEEAPKVAPPAVAPPAPQAPPVLDIGRPVTPDAVPLQPASIPEPPPPAFVPPAPPPEAPPAVVYEPPPVVAPIPPPAVGGPDVPPNYVPPGTPLPGYVPPDSGAPQQQQPRLRDRIIDRIPIIGRFNDPQPANP